MRVTYANSLPDEPISHDPGLMKKVMVRKGTVPHLMMFSTVTVPPNQRLTPHRHTDMWETYFVVSGRGQMVIDGETVELAPGTSVVVEPGEEHALVTHGSTITLTYFGISQA